MTTRAQVFVVDRDALFDGIWPQGYHRLHDSNSFLARARGLGRFVDREEAESNPAWKQLIPYCMLRCGDWSPSGRPADRGVFLVQRTKKGGETRLHNSLSIGLGGHIEPIDMGTGQTVKADISEVNEARTFFASALGRELSEELALPPANQVPAPRLLGLINDDSTEVGEVHAGLAYSIDFAFPLPAGREMVGIREVSKLQGGFRHLVELANLWQTQEQFESWSQFLIQAEISGAMGNSPTEGPHSAESGA